MRIAPLHLGRWLIVSGLALALASCGGGKDNSTPKPQCSDGIDNDGDGLIDFPADPGCVSPEDDSEDSPPSPQCSDGRDNDGDGLIDYPNDPGCSSPQEDSETDDCPNGPMCPQCANGIDDDHNGLTDFPDDPGCSAASDTLEYTENPVACGTALTIKQLPPLMMDTGMFVNTSTIMTVSPCGGGGGGGAVAIAYELHLEQAKVVTVSTEGSAVDTVLDIRGTDCTNMSSEIACNNDISTTDKSSSVTTSLKAGTYFLIVESHNGDIGAYSINVKLYNGEGTDCTDVSMCGPGLVCRVPTGGTDMICTQPECSDGVDNDGDGKIDYPDDPGCTSPSDNDETDDCPSGPMCPECSNGIDDDHDGLTDYPNDPSCKSASGNSEACNTTEGVTTLITSVTMGDLTGATNDFEPTCAEETGGVDLTYELDLPGLTSLSIDVEAPNFDFEPVSELLNSTCGGTAISCEEEELITEGAFAAGTYFLVVDSDFAGEVGAFTVTVTGTIAGGQSCESPLATSGALMCASGFTCAGTAGSRTCKATQCNDGIDNDGDGKIDYPNDPGCTSPSDDDETNPAVLPVCADGMDNDSDGKIDYPTDFGCASAAGTSEAFCALEVDPVTVITMPTTSGDLTNLHANLTFDCGFDTGNDQTWALQLPVGLQSLTITTAGSTSADTVLQFWDPQCTNPSISCDDDDPSGTLGLLSTLTVTNVAGGNYAISVAGYSTADDAPVKVNVSGVLAKGTACTGTLFTNHVTACAAGSTCTAGKCQ